MKNFLKFKDKYVVYVLFVILLLASFFRLYGISWDQNQHLHPDERFLTMVTQAVKWPVSLPQYLNPKLSPLNPYNAGYNFFVYGTLPLKIVKFFSEIVTLDKFDYNNITLVGRLISSLFDIGVVYLVYKIGKKMFDKKVGLLASFLYSISVLPIQLSHFYAVDTFLVFFLTLSFYFLICLIQQKPPIDCHPELGSGSETEQIPKQVRNDSKTLVFSGLLGLTFGLALACKISAFYFLPIIGVGFLIHFIKTTHYLKSFFLCTLLFVVCSYFTFRFSDPRAFATNNLIDPTPSPQFVQNIKQLKSFDNPNGLFPPAVQWIKTKPIIFPLKNLVIWGLGIPLGILTLVGVLFSLLQIARTFSPLGWRINQLLILSWILLLFSYQGAQFAKAMRYFYPIYPFLAILAANFLIQCTSTLYQRIKNKAFFYLLISLVLLSIVIWPLSFVSIYSRPHSRVIASEWIYENIPPGSTISCEHWDDYLPLSLPNKNSSIYRYETETLTLYDPDTTLKWQKINAQLEKVDYLIMSSNRLWGSIPKVPEKYPTTARFYEDLFAEKLQFTKVAEITSYPTVPILNIEIPDDLADESFTVYDHPKILIYKSTNYFY